MSYDLQLYLERDVTVADLVAVLDDLPGLAVESQGDLSFTVVRGARRSYCFTVDGPFAVEPEDVPEEVTAVSHPPSTLCTIIAEGSAASHVPHAIRFARLAATTLGGVVLDQQKDDIWPRTSTRTVTRPAKQERVRTVDVVWFTLSSTVGPDAAEQYLARARALLPEALPRRFGSYEPLQGNLARDGDDAFVSGWQSEDSLFFFTSSLPCVGGRLDALRDSAVEPVWSMGLTLVAEPLEDARWRDSLRRFFVATADDLGAFYAMAEVLEGVIWSGRTVHYDGSTESSSRPCLRGTWLGLPPRPVWWSYYGEPYADVRADAGVEVAETTRHGQLHARSSEPAGRKDLLRRLERGRFLRRKPTPWVDPALVTTFAPNPRHLYPPPLHRASQVPTALTGPHSE